MYAHPSNLITLTKRNALVHTLIMHPSTNLSDAIRFWLVEPIFGLCSGMNGGLQAMRVQAFDEEEIIPTLPVLDTLLHCGGMGVAITTALDIGRPEEKPGGEDYCCRDEYKLDGKGSHILGMRDNRVERFDCITQTIIVEAFDLKNRDPQTPRQMSQASYHQRLSRQSPSGCLPPKRPTTFLRRPQR
jgi:hypothetical protein